MLKHPVFKFFSSLKLAVFSILSLAGILAYGTVVESLYGMRASHLLVFGTWWFFGVLSLLGTNVLCAAISRFPWKRHQTGFVITHTGILIILFGSLMTERFGVDGNLPVQEQQHDNNVIMNDYTLVVENTATGEKRQVPFPESARRRQGIVLDLVQTPGAVLRVDDYLPRLVPEKRIVPTSYHAGSPYIKFRLISERFQVEEWLTTNHPAKPSELNLGPATISFETLWGPADRTRFFAAKKNRMPPNTLGTLQVSFRGKEFSLNVERSASTWKRVGDSGLQVRIEKYYSYAIVEGNELVNKSEEAVNPAVQLYIKGPGSKLPEKHTVFANFPDFATLHKGQLQKSHQKELGVKFRYLFPEKKELAFVGSKRGSLRIAYGFDDRKLYFRAFGANGKVRNEGEINPRQQVPLGWMDAKLEIVQWYPFALEVDEPRYVDTLPGGESNFLSGIHVTPINNGIPDKNEAEWVIEGDTQSLRMAGALYKVHFGKLKKQLPFSLFLDKFTVGTNPGTQKAATYESRVTVRDPAAAVPTQALISMNSPLVYGGYTFYQASYQMAEGMAPISVFAVNYDPGRIVKYVGSIIMVMGIALMFYMNPHYWGILLGKKRD